jgi:hypothetical protein
VLAEGDDRRTVVLLALAETGLGELARRRRELSDARGWLTTALDRLAASTGTLQPRLRLLALTELGRVEIAAGALAAARDHLSQALAEVITIHDARATAEVVEACASLAVAEGDHRQASSLLGLGTAARGTADQGNPDVRATVAAAREGVGEAEFEVAFGATAALSSVQAQSRIAALVEGGQWRRP